MIVIDKDSGLVTLINVFTCTPEKQGAFVQAWIDGLEADLSGVPGLVSSSLHRSLDGTRVVNYAQWRSIADLENLLRVGEARGTFKPGDALATPDPHVYEVVYTLDRSTPPGQAQD